MECGSRVAEVVKLMELHSNAVTPATFKVLEQVRDSDDWEEITCKMQDPSERPSPFKLRQVTTTVLTKRYWSWCLLHPDLGADKIHPSRSMFLLL